MVSVRYLVHDVAKAVDFYTAHLGFGVVEQWGPFLTIVERGELRLWLSGPQTSAARPMPDGRVPAPGGWNRIVIQVENIEQTVTIMKKAGVTFRNEIISGPGGSQVLVEDPSGNPIELFQSA